MDEKGLENRTRIKLDDCLFVVVDMQERLLPEIDRQAMVLSNAVRFLHFCRGSGLPIILVEQRKLGKTVPQITSLTEGKAAIPKDYFDAFAVRAFRDEIRRYERATLLVCGIETHICVAQTALGGLNAGYRVHVVADATSSRHAENRAIGLDRLRLGGAVVTSTEMAIYELLEAAGTDRFRRILPIVKAPDPTSL